MNTTVRTGTTDRGLIVLAAAGWAVTLILLARLFVFAGYPDPPAAWSVAPWSGFMTHHACSTAYWSAASRIGQEPDVWDIRGYSLGQDPVTGRLMPRTIGTFNIDPYEYPPTFLLGPRALATVTPDYFAFRHVWLIVNALLVVGGMVLIARRLDPPTIGRSTWLLPLALAPLTTMYSLQMGNAQLIYLVIAMVALLAFERRWYAAGGLLLAFAVVGKMFPGILLLYLALRRDWRAVGWTAGWAAVLVLVSIADVGWAPFPFFLAHLPKLLSGEAFPMLRQTITAANNMSLPGLVLKLAAFGGPAVPFETIKYAGWLYTLVVLGTTVQLARRPVSDRLAPLAWLTILGVTAFRSPFLPTYGMFPGAWLAAMLFAVCWTDARRWWVVLGLWLVLVPVTAGPVPFPVWAVALFTTTQTVAAVGLMLMAIHVGREDAAPGRPIASPLEP